MRRAALLGLALLLLLPGLAAAAGECAAPAELVEDDPKLPVTAQRLHDGRPLKIVALGGGSTAGAAAGDPAKTWPARLQERMERRWPGVPVTVVNKGVPRQTTQEMVDRLATDVFPEGPSLVIWETGITDAVRGVDVEEFTQTLQAGLDRIRQEKIDVMLMDMQFSRSTSSIINFDRYLEALRKTADLSDVYLFRRYEIMRYWSEHGVFNFDDVPKSERAALAVHAYDCLALRLVDAIAFATR